MIKTMLTGVGAVLLATAFASAPPAQAQTYGHAPWCAVINIGTGEVVWDCQYRTVEECAPNVIAGNRGFCNLNPYGPGPGIGAPGYVAPRYAVPGRHHRRHHPA
jgi:hypothetical protein